MQRNQWRQSQRLRFLGAVLFTVLALILILPGPRVQASDDPGPGYWYQVERGDSWYRIAVKTGVPMRELWRANPEHLRYRYLLYIGERLWIPQRVACPATFADFPTAIGQRLDAANGNLTQVSTWLKACQVQTADLGTLRQYALHDVVESDIVVTIHDLTDGLVMPPGTLLVYHRTGAYELAHQATGEGTVELRAVTDLNADGRREIVWTDTTCGPHTCYSTLFVDQWDGSRYRDWLLGQPQMPTTEYTIGEATSAGTGAEITVHGGALGSVGAGPVRTWSEIYGSPPDKPYERLATVLDPSPCFYHHLLAANQLYNQASSDPAGYGPVITAYTDLLADATLQSCAYADLPNELSLLRDFARFRLVVAYTATGDAAAATAARNQITTPAIQGAADTFLTSFGASSDLAQACAATTVYAVAQPAAWDYLADWGYGNPGFSAEQLCAGTGSLAGLVWHDFCQVADVDSGLPPNPGCVASGGGLYAANGIHEAGEAPIAGVSVTLRNGQCSAADAPPVAATITDNNGAYHVDALAAGDYCVTIALAEGDNTALLVPGGWTQPPTAGAVVSRDVTLAPGEEVENIDFGWDYQ